MMLMKCVGGFAICGGALKRLIIAICGRQTEIDRSSFTPVWQIFSHYPWVSKSARQLIFDLLLDSSGFEPGIFIVLWGQDVWNVFGFHIPVAFQCLLHDIFRNNGILVFLSTLKTSWN